MYSEKFNLSWNEFDNCASNTFKELLGETDFVDVTLVSDDLKQIKAHKVILSACSPKLKKMLQQNPQQHPIIYLSGVAYNEMQSMINFMYLGQTEVEQDNLNLFMEVAARFDVKGLSQENKYNETVHEKQPGKMTASDNRDNDYKVERSDFETMHTEDVGSYENDPNTADVVQDVNEKEVDGQNLYRMHSCEQCEYKAKLATDLKRHKNAVHDGIKFPCEHCDYKSSFSHSLIRHKKNKHSNIY